MRQGDHADCMYIVFEGSIEIYYYNKQNDRDQPIAVIHDRMVIGESAIQNDK